MIDATDRGTLVPPAGWLGPPPDAIRRVGSRYLTVVTILAVILRLYRLGDQSVWVDEAQTWLEVAPDRGFHFWHQIFQAYQSPLYHALAWLAVRVAPTAGALRLPSVIAGALTVPLFGLISGRLFGRNVGRLAALLLALSPFHLWYSQEARGYACLMLFVVASGLMFVRLREGEPNWGRAVAMAVLVAGGLASNLAFLFLLVAYGVTLLLTTPLRSARAWGVWIVALGGGVVLTLPWLLRAAGIWEVDRVLPGAEMGEALRGATTFTPWALPFAMFSLFFGFSLGPSLAELHAPDRLAVLRQYAPIVAPAALVAGAAFTLGLFRLQRKRWALLLWIGIPVLAVTLLAVRNIKPFNVRYVAPAFPWILLVTAAGAARLRRPGNLALSVALCLLFVASLVGYYHNPRFAKPDIRGAVAAIAADDARHLPILAPSVTASVRFYAREGDDVLRCGREPTVKTIADAEALVQRQLGTHDAAWVVWAQTWYLDPHDHLPSALAACGRLDRVYSGPGVTVDLWQRQPTGMAP